MTRHPALPARGGRGPAAIWMLPLLLSMAGCLAASPPAPVADDPPTASAPAADPVTARDTSGTAPALVDRSCRVDADCAVKDVGSCCGVRPACVNRDARVDPAEVAAACRASGRMSICGFQPVTACSCNAGSCRARRDGVAGWIAEPDTTDGMAVAP